MAGQTVKPRVWRQALRQTDFLGQRRTHSLATLGRELVRTGLNLFAVVQWRAEQQPDRDAIIDSQGHLSYRELIAQSEALAAWMSKQHLGSASRRIGVFCRQPRHTVLVLLAAQRCGIGAVLLNTFSSPDEIAAISQKRRLAVLSDDPNVGTLALPTCDVLADSVVDQDRARPPRAWRAAPVTILTSGTTGAPTMVDSRPSSRAVDTISDFVTAVGARRQDRVLMMLPLFHGHGLATVVLTLVLSGTLTLRSPSDQRADQHHGDWQSINDGAIDVIVAVPTILQRLLAADPNPAHPTSHVRAIVTGSAPIDPSTVVEVTGRFGPVLHNVYGTSETGVLTHAGPNDLTDDPTTVGRPLLGIDCEIRRDSVPVSTSDTVDTVDTVDSVGTLWVRGGMGGRTWRSTNDLASFDPQGRLRLHGRVDDVLVIGGENVLPEALEARIASLVGVVECAVRGVPDHEYGTRVELLVRLESGHTIEQLHQTLDANLPRSLRPTSILLVEHLPRTALGKLQRHLLPAGSR